MCKTKIFKDKESGLNLHGGVDDWGVGSDLMVKAMAWVNSNV